MNPLRFILAALLLCVFALSSEATIIQPTNRVDWIPGVTVGSRLPVGGNTHSNYISGINTNGIVDNLAVINAAIQAASSNDCLYLPEGWIRADGLVLHSNNNVTLSCVGTNNKMFGIGFRLVMGANAALESPITVNITSGSIKGSTNISCDSVAGITTGDIVRISTLNPPTNELKVISSLGFERVLNQNVVVTGISGTNLFFSPPLVWDFTHSPTVQDIQAASVNPIFFTPHRGLGLENINLTGDDPTSTNYLGGLTLLQIQTCYDSWVTGCSFEYPGNYAVMSEDVCHLTFRGNRIQYATGGGTSHTGLIIAYTTGSLFENNIFADTGQGGLMFNTGVMGDAFFGNYFINTGQTILMHQTHPMMNLFEANSLDFLELDGYYGSNSHETLFRNDIHGSESSVWLNRWSTYIQMVGNVLGLTNTASEWMGTNNGGATRYIVRVGYPNIGNQNYDGSTLSTAWNNPAGGSGTDFVTFTNTGSVVPTNILHGNFSFVPTYSGGNNAGIMFTNAPPNNFDYPAQDYKRWTWTTNGVTSTNLTLNEGLYVSGVLTFYVHGPAWYQQLQVFDIDTDNITANFDYAGNAMRYNSNPDHFLEASLLYTSSPPPWIGTNRWPWVNPTNATMVTESPAESRFLGKGGGTNFYTMTLTTNGAGTIVLSPSASSYADGTVVAVTATANSGNTFTGWSGDIGGSVNPTNITMSASKSVTGNFETNAIVRTRIVFH